MVEYHKDELTFLGITKLGCAHEQHRRRALLSEKDNTESMLNECTQLISGIDLHR